MPCSCVVYFYVLFFFLGSASLKTTINLLLSFIFYTLYVYVCALDNIIILLKREKKNKIALSYMYDIVDIYYLDAPSCTCIEQLRIKPFIILLLLLQLLFHGIERLFVRWRGSPRACRTAFEYMPIYVCDLL